MHLDILFEDNHLIAINKPPGAITQGDKTGDTAITEHVSQYLKTTYQKPGNVYLGLVHRLDRPASGILLMAKTSKAAERLSAMIQQRTIRKFYYAVTGTQPDPPAAKLTDYLAKNERQNKSYRVSEGSKGAKLAVLEYQLKAASDHYFLLDIELMTGRHHQIRAQLSSIGCPIKGDLKYGAPRSNKDGSIHLHARALEFVHPVQKTDVIITAPAPDEVVWNALVQKNSP
jgi:23S rRNA pseudouridine1911/1915/1917 synthase